MLKRILHHAREGVLIAMLLAMLWPASGLSSLLTEADNPHNLSTKALDPEAGGTDQICIFCHIPHSATKESTLWSRPEPTGPNGDGSFPLYAGDLVIKGDYPASPADALDHSQYGTGIYPSGASRMCMSCHDGVSSIGILSDGTTIAMAGGWEVMPDVDGLKVDLSTSHPVSFVYDATVLADIQAARGGGFQLPSTSDDVDTPLDGKSRMQCTTCHDPHDDTRTAVGLPFWRQTTTVTTSPYQDVCMACHSI